ncbi:hypothetical protein TKK_0005552 [Trichogramma kaykai]
MQRILVKTNGIWLSGNALMMTVKVVIGHTVIISHTENVGNKSSESDEEMRANIILEFQQKKSRNVTNNLTKKDQLNIPPTQQDLQHQLEETHQPDLSDKDVNANNNSLGNDQNNIATLNCKRGNPRRTDQNHQQLQNGENISQLLGLNDENENNNNSLGKNQENFPLRERQKDKPQHSDQNDQQLVQNTNGSDVSSIQENFDDLLARKDNIQRTIKPRLQGKTSIHKLDTLGKRHEIYLGLDVLPEMEVYEKTRRIKKPTIFCRDMADIIWAPKKLVNRAIGLEYCKKKQINKFSPRKELEVDKKELWEDEFDRYLTKKNVSKSLKEALKADLYVTLGQKIQDLRKYYKQLRRASGAPDTGWIFDEHYDP